MNKKRNKNMLIQTHTHTQKEIKNYKHKLNI